MFVRIITLQIINDLCLLKNFKSFVESCCVFSFHGKPHFINFYTVTRIANNNKVESCMDLGQ